jgi:putative ABC transport system permease protein
MSRFDGLRHRLYVLWKGNAYDDEIRRELRVHQQLDALAGQQSLGNETYYREEVRRMTILSWVDRVDQDLRYAVRGLRRSPGFALAITLTLGLGLGANAAMLTLLDRVFLQPPKGVPNPNGLRRLYVQHGIGATGIAYHFRPTLEYPQFRAADEALRGRVTLAAYNAPDSMDARIDAARYPIRRSLVTPAYFGVIGIQPQRGRFFADDERDVTIPARVAVISDAFWRRAFGGSDDAIGRRITMEAAAFTIVGVAPPEFTGLNVDAVDVWAPASNYSGSVGYRGLPWYQNFGSGWRTFARPTSAAAEADLANIATNAIRLIKMKGLEHDSLSRIAVGSIVEAAGPVDRTTDLTVAIRVAGVAGMVFLIAWANVLNLLLLCAARRGREIAVRRALGVSRKRLVEQLIVEATVLACGGALAAILFAFWTGLFVRRLVLPSVRWADGPVDGRTMVVITISCAIVGVIGGLLPAWHALQPDLTQSLRTTAASRSARESTTRSALLALQIALCVVLLVGAGLFINSLNNVRSIGTGFDMSDRLLISPRFDDPKHHVAEVRAALPEVARRLRNVPGVEAVAYAAMPPLGGATYRDMFLPGRDSLPKLADDWVPTENEVSPDFFRAAGLALRDGREFADADGANAPRVAVVDEVMARVFWPGERAVGKCLILDKRDAPCTTVVGVVASSHRFWLIEGPTMHYYRPMAQSENDPSLLIVHTRQGATVGVARAAETALRPLVTDLIGVRVRKFESVLTDELRPWQLGVTLIGSLAVLAVLVAAVGVYSVVAYGVSRRLHEMGVRVALGAQRSHILDLVLGDGLRVVGLGIGVGLFASVVLGRLMASLLFGVDATDVSVMIQACVVIIVVAAVGCAVPAWRASAANPADALRVE